MSAPGPLETLLRSQPVLVTGAGGSIGTELCHQIAAIGPSRLVILGHGENPIFELDQQLRERFPGLPVEPVIADIRDQGRMASVFAAERPAVVFHAAAHKHVPLMESQPAEAITNNVIGTRILCELSAAHGVAHLALISTDKAVRPAGIMGATKRIAEQIVQHAARKHRRHFVAVRFGNVIGTRGSVIPSWARQIEAGGPVTVTHPEMRRYFMTCPEAVSLVMQAAALGEGGEIFVLDMGMPVSILQLAESMIRQAGKEPGRDIAIEVTGTRPGEKLYEEPYFSTEEAEPTEMPRILRARSTRLPGRFLTRLRGLARAVSDGASDDQLRRCLTELVPDYAPRAG